MRRLDTVTKLIEEVQETLREILRVQKNMGDEEFIRVNLDIQKLHSVKELIKLPLYNEPEKPKALEDEMKKFIESMKKKGEEANKVPYTTPRDAFDKPWVAPRDYMRDPIWTLGPAMCGVFDESGVLTGAMTRG